MILQKKTKQIVKGNYRQRQRCNAKFTCHLEDCPDLNKHNLQWLLRSGRVHPTRKTLESLAKQFLREIYWIPWLFVSRRK